MRSEVEEDLVARQHTRPSVVEFHLEGFGRQKASVAHDQFGTARPVNLQVLRNLPVDHLALALTNRCHVDGDRAGQRPVVSAAPRHVGNPRA